MKTGKATILLTTMALGLSIVSGGGAASASAAPMVKAEHYPALISGEGTLVLTTNTLKFSGVTKLSGVANSESSTVKLAPEFAFKAFAVKVVSANNGCSFVLHPELFGPPATGSLAVECEKAGSAITLNPFGWGCEVRIPAQAGTQLLSFSNIGSGKARAIKVLFKDTSLQYSESGPECATPGTHTNGKLEGEVTLHGHEYIGGSAGPEEGIWVE